MSSIGRAFTISQARALEGKARIPVYFLPPAEAVAASPDIFINYHRVRIDPEKAENTDRVLSFTIDGKQAVGLHVRRGVVEYIPDLSSY
ncbi:MAG TPA: hypothetical protein EYP19_01735 [Desulfobacterales bacterium]|nr:hypothetical protein [Desulfobacterales bacterium]